MAILSAPRRKAGEPAPGETGIRTRLRFGKAALALLALGPVAAIASLPLPYAGPYVLHPGPDRALVAFITDSPSSEAEAEAKATDEALVEVEIDGSPRLFPATAVKLPDSGLWLWKAAVEGLAPRTRYRYSLRSHDVEAVGGFTTPPLPGSPEGIRFAVLGDSQSQPWAHAGVAAALAAAKPDFVLKCGDSVANGDDRASWKAEFFDPGHAYLSDAAIFPVRGNHDGDGRDFFAFFDLAPEKPWYAFTWGNALIVGLDQFSGNGSSRGMREWLEALLSANRSEWIVVFDHVPTFNIGGHRSDWGRSDFLPLFEAYGVDVVISGHSHIYERFKPIGSGDGHAVTYIVSGGGGAPLSRTRTDKLLAADGRDYHYCLFEIQGSRLYMEARTDDGRVIDSFLLDKGDETRGERLEGRVERQTAIERLKSAFITTGNRWE